MTSVFGHCKSEPSIPIEQLDYGYIEKCQDTDRLQKILEILRSGEEGKFPHLETFAEQQLAKRKPDSVLLEKIRQEITSKDLPKDDLKSIIDGLKDLPSDMKDLSRDSRMNHKLPPIRTTSCLEKDKPVEKEKVPALQNGMKSKKVAPRSYDEWEKVGKQIDEGDFEKICHDKKVKTDTSKNQKQAHDLLSRNIVEDFIYGCDEERIVAALKEKNKGNEAFRCGDYEEALVYYDRSIDISASVASYNNRAITLIKLERFEAALGDCNKVISEEPDNIKAYLRRGIANESLHHLEEAFEDFSKVLELEPNNKRGKELFNKISRELEKQKGSRKKKGTRLKIEEINNNVETDVPNVSIQEVGTEESAQLNVNTGDYNDKKGDSGCVNSCNISNNQSALDNINDGSDCRKKENIANEDQIKPCEKKIANKNEINVDMNNELGDQNLLVKQDSTEPSAENKASEISQDSVKEPPLESSVKEAEVRVVQVKQLPDSVIQWKNEGNHMHKTGRYAEACDFYTKCIHTLLEDASTYTEALSTLFSNRSSCYMRMGNTRQCIHDCDKSIKFAPSSKAYLRRATAYESLEKYRDAYRDYQTLLRFDPTNATAFQALSRLGNALRMEHGSKWRDCLLKTDELSASKKESQNSSSNITSEKKESNDDKTQNIDNRSPSSYSDECSSNQISDVLPKTDINCNIIVDQNSKQSIDSIATSKAPSNSNNCTSTQKGKLAEGNSTNKDRQQKSAPESCLENKNKLSNEEQTNCDNENSKKMGQSNSRASEESDKKRKEKTVKERFLEIKNQGNSFVQKGKYKEAAQNYTECIELLPEEVPSFTNRALCFLKLKQPEKAIEDCTKALQLQPDNVKALFRRSQGSRMKKDYKESLADLKTIIKLEPNNKAAKEEMEACKAEFHAELRNIQAKNERLKKNEKNKKPLMKEGIKIPIEEVLSEADEIPVKGKLTTKIGKCPLAKTGNSPPKVPTLKKMTGYEFLHAWNSIKSNKTSLYAELLAQVEPSKLPEMLSNKLDGDILKNFIHAVHEHFISKDTFKHGILLLRNLSRASRFLTMLMFLNTSEKTLLSRTIDMLETRAKINEKSLLSEINHLRSSYLVV